MSHEFAYPVVLAPDETDEEVRRLLDPRHPSKLPRTDLIPDVHWKTIGIGG